MRARTFREQPICQVIPQCFHGERGWPHAPEHTADTQGKNPEAVYEAHELDIPDSDVISMWESSEVRDM